jgi:hypothetical protein
LRASVAGFTGKALPFGAAAETLAVFCRMMEDAFGEVAEWSNAAVSKTVVPSGTVSSNLTLSATVPNSQRLAVLVFWALR